MLPGSGSDELFIRSVFAGAAGRGRRRVGRACAAARGRRRRRVPGGAGRRGRAGAGAGGRDLARRARRGALGGCGAARAGGGAAARVARVDGAAVLPPRLPLVAARLTAAQARAGGVAAAVAATAGAPAWLAAELGRAWAGYGAGLAPALEAAADEPAPTEAELAASTCPSGSRRCWTTPCTRWRWPRRWHAALPRSALVTTPTRGVRRRSRGARPGGGAGLAARRVRLTLLGTAASGAVVPPRLVVGASPCRADSPGPPPAACVLALVEEVGRRPRRAAAALGGPRRGRRVDCRFLRPRPLGGRHPRGQGRVDVGGGRSVPPTRVVLVALVSLVEQVGGQPLGARGARAVWTPSRRLATGSTGRGRRGRPTARRPARWRWSSRPRRARCCGRDAAARAAQSGRGPRLRRRRPAGQRPATAGRRRSRRAKHRRAR